MGTRDFSCTISGFSHASLQWPGEKLLCLAFSIHPKTPMYLPAHKKKSSCIQDRKSEITLRQQKQQEDLHSLRGIIIHDTALIRFKW